MNDAQHTAYTAYLRQLADLMELRDWRFTFAIELLKEERYAAECGITYGRRHACIRVNPETLDNAPEDIRQTFVHELVHCHTNPIRDQLDNVEAQLGKAAYTTIHNATTDVLELATEALANALAPFMPLPPNVKGGENDGETIKVPEAAESV
jgi:hypothetical protein